jgi:hypothetical protein
MCQNGKTVLINPRGKNSTPRRKETKAQRWDLETIENLRALAPLR